MGATEEGPVWGGVTDSAVAAATGRDWAQWFAVLDGAGAAAWDHKEAVRHLEREHPSVSPWWRQSITVAFEQARGKREVGQTADVGFQIGVQRSISAPLDEVWETLVTRPELWLGAGVDPQEPGRYEVVAGDGKPGARGVIRVVRPGHRLRMTWQPEGWPAPATLQLTLSRTPSDKTRIGVHLEKLRDAAAREEMRAHWRAVLDRLGSVLE